MRLRHFASTCVLAAAVTLSAPALAHDKHKRDMRPDWNERGHYDDPAYDMVRRGPEFSDMRQGWLTECRMRVAGRGGPGAVPVGPGPGPRDACETALDNYYASGPGYGPGVIMVPVTIPAPPCVETVTTNYVPARRVIRRPAPRPDKRIRIVPDKRIPIK